MQSKTQPAPAREQAAAVPLGDFDVFEDEDALVNRLYYGFPVMRRGCFAAQSSSRKTPLAKRPTGT